MKYGIYSIRDRKTGFYPPTCDQNDASAVRNFEYAVNKEGLINYSPQDFDLYKIGYFDVESGHIEIVSPIEMLTTAIDVCGEMKK